MSLEWKEFCDINKLDYNDKVSMKLFYLDKSKCRLNQDGSIKYVTEQSCKDECDINVILKKYPQRVYKAQLRRDELIFADVSGLDFQRCKFILFSCSSRKQDNFSFYL